MTEHFVKSLSSVDFQVRNHHYEEALQLHNYVKKLNKKLPTVPIIEDIARNVDNSVKLMLQQLLGQLRSPVQLPQCLKVYILLTCNFSATPLNSVIHVVNMFALNTGHWISS